MSEFAPFASAASPHGASRGYRLGALQARAKTPGNHTGQAMLYSVLSHQHGFWALFCYWCTPFAQSAQACDNPEKEKAGLGAFAEAAAIA